MFQTKKQLKEEIKALREKLEREKSINQIRQTSGLAPCEGIICKSCQHGVFVDEEAYGVVHKRLIGCDMTVLCPNYTKTTK